MKPALLNSIYLKLSQESHNDLNSLVNNYSKKIFMLYLDALHKAGVNDVNEKIKVSTKFDDGYVLNSVFKAGHHIIESIFESEEFKATIDEFDKMFLENCPCPNKINILHTLKSILIEIGGESADQEEWVSELEKIQACEDFNSFDELNNIDDFES